MERELNEVAELRDEGRWDAATIIPSPVALHQMMSYLAPFRTPSVYHACVTLGETKALISCNLWLIKGLPGSWWS